MRIVIDLQGAQSTGSRNRGIGRYSTALAKAIIGNCADHEVVVSISGLFFDSVQPIIDEFEGVLPRSSIRVWDAVGPTGGPLSENAFRRAAAELTREAFIASLYPDVVLVTSLFEGLTDDAVTSVGTFGPRPLTAVVLYDLIPLIHRSPYLDNPQVEAWYMKKTEYLKRADLLLAISHSTRREAATYLGIAEERCVNISSDAEPQFREIEMSSADELELRERYGLSKPFVMYTGGIDHRKNIEGLISAFSRLPLEVRDNHTLAIVCSINPTERARLEKLGEQLGLKSGDLVLTGFVPEEDLTALYNLCALFVFPSLHEGFGLPALEAMRCGAVVIGSNTSSIPEVIGLEEALFDPQSEGAIVAAMYRGLTDAAYRGRLLDHGKTQAAAFSWDASARKAIAAMERLVLDSQNSKATDTNETAPLPRLAYVSPLPPERSGIADYSSELLRYLAKHYQIDVVVDQKEISDDWIIKNCGIRTGDWLRSNFGEYDRVVYHFGNSIFHRYMFALLDEVPGVVVLHDFFLSSIAEHLEISAVSPGFWITALYDSHGYAALNKRLTAPDTAEVVWTYPCSLGVIRNSVGVITHSTHTLDLAKEWYDDGGDRWDVIPLLRDPEIQSTKQVARERLGFKASDFVVCTYGMVTSTKQSLRLLKAWKSSSLGNNPNSYLVFAGENHPGDYGQQLLRESKVEREAGRIRITGWLDAETYQDYLAVADIAVQLRTLSRGETSAAVLDCMKYGLATIVNANGSMAGLADDAVLKLADNFADDELVEALERLWRDEDLRSKLGLAARGVILDQHDPSRCAARYHQAIERFYLQEITSWRGLSRAIGDIPFAHEDTNELIQVALTVSRSHPRSPYQRQIFVDVSTLVQGDAGTGVQRVVRNVLRHWLYKPPAGYRIEPVYASTSEGYRYARQFSLSFMGLPGHLLADEPIEFGQGDVFLGLDLQPFTVVAQKSFYQQLRQHGVWVGFVVYDLLTVQMPQHFPVGANDAFLNWLSVVAENDGAICISQAVADDMRKWVCVHAEHRKERLRIGTFRMGADLDDKSGSVGVPHGAADLLRYLATSPTFIMVGTIEPRKGHAQVVGAFEALVKKGLKINLIIVGKSGWSSESFLQALRFHPLLGERIFWLEGVSDQYLDQLYAASTCLIAASEGEGFGLPLIEAARNNIPVLARDIPVFREVAGVHASYFAGETGDDIAVAIERWLELYDKGEHPRSDGIQWQTWAESADQLLTALGPQPALQ